MLAAAPWAELSVGVAAVLGLVYVARTMRGIVRETLDRVGALQSEVLTFIGNHMSSVTGSLGDVAENLAGLNVRVDQLHDDNVETARVLAREDKSTTRKVAEQNQKPKTRARAAR